MGQAGRAGRAGQAGRRGHKGYMAVACSVACALALAMPHARAQAPTHEIYAARFATLANFPLSSLVAGADRSRRMDIAMMVWVLKGADGRAALVDSGFHREQYFRQFAVKDYVPPPEALAPLGIGANDVTDILLTHMHWDHAGGIDLFPSARVWIQKDEYDYYTGEAWQSDSTHGGIDADDMQALLKANTAGRLKFVNGDDQEVLPGLRCYSGARHTWQSQYCAVQTRSGTVVLASDNMYLYENLEKHAPIAQTLDAAANLRAQDRMKELAAKPELIVPGHDPAQLRRFPKVAEGVVRID